MQLKEVNWLGDEATLDAAAAERRPMLARVRSTRAPTAATAGGVPSMPVTGILPFSPSARSASLAPWASSSFAAQMPPILSPYLVSQALTFSSASLADQLATWKSSSVISGCAFRVWSRPFLRSIAAVFEICPPSATMAPLPPMALMSASVMAVPLFTPSNSIWLT